MISRLLAAASAITLAAHVIVAQSADSLPTMPPTVFLEKAYFSVGTPSGKHLLFEGEPTVHYFLLNTLTDPQWQAEGGWAFAVPVSSIFLVRVTRDNVPLQNGERSVLEPVLTPSYHIGIRPQAFYLYRPQGLHYVLAGFTGGLTHYSNGQHGCTYLGFTRVSSGDCTIADAAVAATRTANVVDGDFSTTYFSEALDVRWAEQTTRFGTMKWQLAGGIEFQQDPLNFRPGGTNQEQAVQYGQRGLLLRTLGEARHVGRLGGVARLELKHYSRFGGGMTSTLNATQGEQSYVFDGVGHFGLFAREHWGFDYYNIHFQERQWFWSAGIMWDLGRLDHLHSCFRHVVDTPHGHITVDHCGSQ